VSEISAQAFFHRLFSVKIYSNLALLGSSK